MKYKNQLLSNILIYILIATLFILIIINFYNIFKNKTYKNNSANVVSFDKNEVHSILEVYYNEDFIFKLSKITEADIVYQWYDSIEDSLKYSGIFYNKDINHHNSINRILNIDISDVPSTKFIDSIEDEDINFDNDANNITINFKNNLSSKLTYNNGFYYHKTDSKEDIDYIDNTHNSISFMNIVVIKLSNKNYKSLPENKSFLEGEGFIFTNGKVKNVLFKNNTLICEKTLKQVPLVKGKTLWTFISPINKIIYSK